MVLPGENGEPDLFAGTITNHGIVDNVDATTHLYNIYEFFNALRSIKQTGKPSMVMLIGLNQFRHINDVYGYIYGNQILKEFGALLSDMVRGKGMAYRIDGAKFAIRVNQMDETEARQFYNEMQTRSRELVQVNDRHISLGISAGAMYVDGNSPGEYAIQAGLRFAQNRSKRDCHSELVFYNNEDGYTEYKSLEMYECIRQSVLDDCDGFYLCYQPLVRAKDGEIVGMEALLRWNKEPYGEVPPGGFIEWLEQEDCFFELGNWIFRQALLDAKEILKDKPDFVVNVNVSYTQLDRSDFRDALMGILEETGFPPQNLYIELTERCRTMDMDRLIEILDFFTSCGIKIALDDFGTGTASMNLLRKLPIDCLKIDRAFISNIQTNLSDEVIVELIIDSANKLGMSVCLEGVENKEICDYVKKYNAKNHQGYYYSRPVRIEKFQELLQ
jgi:diguanylate cyclase (GGDEF)-like protein